MASAPKRTPFALVAHTATDLDLVESYADLAPTLEAPHGPDHACLACADARYAWGLEPLLIDPWDLIGARWLA